MTEVNQRKTIIIITMTIIIKKTSLNLKSLEYNFEAFRACLGITLKKSTLVCNSSGLIAIYKKNN